jgi:endonuclease/exonuclease/phosphatase family metal-dependent hydrolase
MGWLLLTVTTRAADLPDLDLLTTVPEFEETEVSVVSFNIQFLGNFKSRRNAELARLLAPYDLIFVQELVAPPYPGRFPDGSQIQPDKEAQAFFDAMAQIGFDYILSPEDTGSGPTNHLNSSATEWFVAFYKNERVQPLTNLPNGFLADDRTDNTDYERVPYAFAFQAENVDLVFISVHLMPGSGREARKRRAHELGAIASWVKSRQGTERDFIILGDMNIEDCRELTVVLPPNYSSLNHDCVPTNTNINSPKPYDHVMYQTQASASEINIERGMIVIDLIKHMRRGWPARLGRYPGRPYVHDSFRKFFSDHDPVLFSVRADADDDD